MIAGQARKPITQYDLLETPPSFGTRIERALPRALPADVLALFPLLIQSHPEVD